MNLDMIVHADRIPLKGETIKGGGLEYQPGGKGANQAVAMAKLGADVTMFGCVGDDSAGRRLLENLRACGVAADAVEMLKGVPTGQAIITAGGGDQYYRDHRRRQWICKYRLCETEPAKDSGSGSYCSAE